MPTPHTPPKHLLTVVVICFTFIYHFIYFVWNHCIVHEPLSNACHEGVHYKYHSINATTLLHIHQFHQPLLIFYVMEVRRKTKAKYGWRFTTYKKIRPVQTPLHAQAGQDVSQIFNLSLPCKLPFTFGVFRFSVTSNSTTLLWLNLSRFPSLRNPATLSRIPDIHSYHLNWYYTHGLCVVPVQNNSENEILHNIPLWLYARILLSKLP